MSERVATFYDYVRFTETVCSKRCVDCPVSESNNGLCCPCGELMQEHTDEYNEILLKWVDEHPIKTYADDFFEHFPNALKHHENYPIACRQNIYGGDCNYEECKTCWNQPYKESEDEE